MHQLTEVQRYYQKKFVESENFMKLFLVGPVLYMLFSLADFIKYPDLAYEFLSIRVVASSLMLMSYGLTRRNKSFNKNQLFTLFSTIIASVGITYMIYRSGDLLSSYYSGLTIVAIIALLFGVFESRYFYVGLMLVYLPYYFMCLLNYDNIRDFKEFIIYNFFNLGFIVAIILVNIRKNHDLKEIFLSEMKLENEIKNRGIIIEQNVQEISNLKIKELELAQQSFLFDMLKKISHDIRSPLSTLNIISKNIDKPEFRDLHKDVVSQINKIAEEFLSYSKDRNKLYVKNNTQEIFKIVNLFDLLKNEYKLKSEFLQRKITFNYEISEIGNICIGNELATSRYSIINNLIQNAVEATNENNGEISIKISKNVADDILSIEIGDNGVGIPKDLINKLGKEKISYGKVGTKNSSGNGIGLYNATKILRHAGASLSLHSSEQSGAMVKIELPSNLFHLYAN